MCDPTNIIVALLMHVWYRLDNTSHNQVYLVHVTFKPNSNTASLLTHSH